MNEFDNHSRVIIHIDIDCYYAQIEMNKNPQLQTVPMGVKQKNFIVTSNYIAREYGIKKCMYVDEALKLCPQLVTVNGEDLHDYRQISYQLTELLHKYSNLVERLGLDENFIDVTHLVKERLKEYNGRPQLPEPIGCVFRDINDDDDDKCECGCYENLIIGTIIAREIRDDIQQQLNLTVCAGIAHNKILAKIVGKQNKPNQQTVVFPHNSLSLISSLKELINIPGIGRVTAEQLETLKMTTVDDIRNADLKRLEIVLGGDKAKFIYNLCYGIDNSPVKISKRPQSIGIEDSYSTKSISAQNEIEEKLRQLLDRLLVLVNEDGRIPKTIKLTVRKLDKNNKISHRETRQCNINPSLFNQQKQQINTTTTRETKLMSTILHLFNRIVDRKKPYHITLLGLAFTKFHEPPKTSIVQFLRKNLEVQSITSIESTTNQIVSSPTSSVSSIEMQSPTPSTSSLENSPSPSPKKLKLTNLITKSMGFHNNNNNNNTDECSSPSKLRVADLCLTTTTNINDDILCPPTADKDVFKELPSEIQKELWENYKRERDSCCSSQVKKSKPNTLLNYFVKN